jgi:hypothetical protein
VCSTVLAHGASTTTTVDGARPGPFMMLVRVGPSVPIKETGPADDPVVHRWEGGLTWLAHPDEGMERASHALVVDDDVWVVEPLAVDGLDDLLADLGEVAGVVVLADYHRRDAAAVARRHDAPVVLPPTVAHLGSEVDAPVAPFAESLGTAGVEAIPLYGGLPWAEAALYHPASGTLAATESLVTGSRHTLQRERLAVMPYVRLFPPREALGGLDVERVLTGHGDPVLEDAGPALETALASARRGAPRIIGRNLPYLLRGAWVAARD